MLVALWDVSNQFNDNNGSILTNGKIYVYYSGRAALAPTWSSADGSHVNPNPIILDNNGRAVAFADDQYTYTCVVCDFYGKELFSFDPASFGTGGGGSTTEGNDAAHWIGASGTDVQVTALADTLLPLPSSPDYEGDFVGQTTYTTISLNKGLYMVDADIRIQQDDDDLENIIKDISVYTGLSGPDSLTTSQKNWTGPEASDDRHFVHVHFIRHIADEGEDLYFQMNSPVDLSQAWIDKLSIVKLTEGGNGKSYVGGYGIDITGPVISVSGMIPEASAANFVDVSTYNTDIENIYETIAETSAMIPSGVATEQFVEDFTSAFITEDALNGYATEQWVEDQHFITSADIPPIPQDVVTSGELATVSGDIISQIPSLDGYATQQWVEDQHYITSADIPEIPEDVVTSGQLATVSAQIENDIPNYTATLPIVIDGSNNISLKYGNTLVLTNTSTTYTVETNDYGNMAWQVTGEPSESDNLQINSPSSLSVIGASAGNHLRLRIDLDDTDNYIDSKVNLLSGGQEITLDGTSQTISGFQTPEGSTWASIFDFSTHPISDMYASQAVYGEVLVELWEYEGDTPIRPQYGGSLRQWPWGITIQFTSSEAGLNVANPLPSPGNIPNYVLTSNGTGGSYWAPAGDVPADLVTSGELATVSGNIMNEIPSYTAGSHIDITNNEISVTGVSGLFAGENITITTSGGNYYINGTGEVPEDLVTSAQLATVSGQIENDIPDVSDMATQTWVGQQGYITANDIPADLVTSGELATVSAAIENDIPDTSDMATKTWVNQQGFITSLPEDLVTSGELATVSGDIVSQIPSQTTVSIDPTLSSGTKIAEFNINGTSGELYAPQGGGSVEGGLEAVSFPMVINDDKTYIAMRYSQRGFKAEVTYGYYYPTMVSGKYIYPCIPWDMARSTSPGAVLRGSISIERTYSLTNCRIAWFPTTDTDKFLIDLRSSFSYGSGKSTSWAYCPPSTSPDYPVDTTNWTKVGDWSSITGPIINWYVGIIDVTDNTLYEITQLGYQRNANTLEPALGRGLTWTSRTGYGAAPDQYDIAVTNPVPNATNNQGYVLTENGDGTFGWAAPTGGSEVDIIPSLQTGTKIADYVIDGTSGALYAPAGGGGSTYYAGDHIVIDQNNYISTSGLMVENSAFMIDSAGYANRVTDGGEGGTLNVGTVSNDPLQVIGMQDDIEYTLNCSGNTDGVQIYQGDSWSFQQATTRYPTNNEIKFTKSDFDLISSTGNYYLHFANAWSGIMGNNVTLTYGGSGITNTRYALVDQLPTSGQLIPSGGTNGQVLTKVSGSPTWTTPFKGIYSYPIGTTPTSIEVVTALPATPDSTRIYLIPES